MKHLVWHRVCAKETNSGDNNDLSSFGYTHTYASCTDTCAVVRVCVIVDCTVYTQWISCVRMCLVVVYIIIRLNASRKATIFFSIIFNFAMNLKRENVVFSLNLYLACFFWNFRLAMRNAFSLFNRLKLIV